MPVVPRLRCNSTGTSNSLALVLSLALRCDRSSFDVLGSSVPQYSSSTPSHLNAKESARGQAVAMCRCCCIATCDTAAVLSHLYLSGGARRANVSAVRTTNNITNADGTLANNQIQAVIRSGRWSAGLQLGFGFRFVDEFNSGGAGSPLQHAGMRSCSLNSRSITAQPVGSGNWIQPVTRMVA